MKARVSSWKRNEVGPLPASSLATLSSMSPRMARATLSPEKTRSKTRRAAAISCDASPSSPTSLAPRADTGAPACPGAPSATTLDDWTPKHSANERTSWTIRSADAPVATWACIRMTASARALARATATFRPCRTSRASDGDAATASGGMPCPGSRGGVLPGGATWIASSCWLSRRFFSACRCSLCLSVFCNLSQVRMGHPSSSEAYNGGTENSHRCKGVLARDPCTARPGCAQGWHREAQRPPAARPPHSPNGE
mmetsp:Transcript_8947/g.26019  ORF Transcript_8947/g.26019 Transcript_8947/m.26019 type:complete len:255 (-) Transcript_8947:202-966(-)